MFIILCLTLLIFKMPKIDITSLDTYEDNEESFEKMRSRKPKQQREVRPEKKHHREKKVEI